MDSTALTKDQYVKGRCVDCHRYVEKKARDIHPDNCSERGTEHYQAVAQSLGLDISPPTKQGGPDQFWPEGYRRPKDGFTIVQEIAYGSLGIIFTIVATAKGAGLFGALIFLIVLVLLAWLEWSGRCEDRSLVNKVTAAVIAAEGAILVAQHERREREAAQRQQQDAYRDAAVWALAQQRQQDNRNGNGFGNQNSNQPTPLQIRQGRDAEGCHLNQFGYRDGSL